MSQLLDICSAALEKSRKDSNMKETALVMAFDEGYAECSLVALHSALKRCSIILPVVCVVPRGFPVRIKKAFTGVATASNTDVEFIEAGSFFDGVESKIPHISTPTFYRLQFPELLTEFRECIYLDGDTLVLDDIASLIRISMGNSYLLGVKAPYWSSASLNRKLEMALKSVRDRTLISGLHYSKYINAGVLRMNLEAMRKVGIVKKFQEYMHLGLNDQDILNKCCHRHIGFIAPRYNLMTKYLEEDAEGSYKWARDDIGRSYTSFEMREALDNPCIVHFADKDKPWNSDSVPFGDKWKKERAALNRALQVSIDG